MDAMTENNSPGGWSGQPQQPPYGQPDPAHSQSPYGPDPYGQPHDQSPYGQSPYGQNPYGAAPYSQNPYGAAPYGQPYGYPGQQGEPTLGQPHYGIGLVDAVKRGFAKYARFDGRASRSEFWWWQLAVNGAFTVLGIVALVVALATSPDGGDTPGAASIPLAILLLVLGLATIVPTIAVTVRRLHDTNQSGLLYLITLVPYVGGFIVLILCIMASNPQGVRYDDPARLS